MHGKSLYVSTIKWVLDSGASHHMTSHEYLLENLHNLHELISIGLPNGRIILVKKVESVNLGGGLKLKEVLHILAFKENLILVQQKE